MKLIATSLFLLAALAGCGPSKTGTCASTCTKSIALMCPAGEMNQAACEMSCNMQKTKCEGLDLASTFQDYLDCIESNDMVCGGTTMSPTSEDCVNEGLATLPCAS